MMGGEGLVEYALNASYRLSPVASTRLRRMTKAAGLPAENILGRLAISFSLSMPDAPPQITSRGQGKEIRGSTLLGKPNRGAALLVALAAQTLPPDEPTGEGVRALLTRHVDRGLAELHKHSVDGDPMPWLALRTVDAAPSANGDARPGGHGETPREVVAAALGKRYGRWPLEVRRLVAMAGRCDIERAMAVAARLAEAVGPGTMVSEGLAVRQMTSWGLNRLGLANDDRAVLSSLSEAGGALRHDDLRLRDRAALPFLMDLGLLESDGVVVSISAQAQALGEDLWL